MKFKAEDITAKILALVGCASPFVLLVGMAWNDIRGLNSSSTKKYDGKVYTVKVYNDYRGTEVIVRPGFPRITIRDRNNDGLSEVVEITCIGQRPCAYFNYRLPTVEEQHLFRNLVGSD